MMPAAGGARTLALTGNAARQGSGRQFGGVTGALLLVAGVLAIGGMAIASYLTVVHYAGQPIVCSSIGDCERVNSSAYADVAGVPVAGLGAVAYATMLLLIVAAVVRPEPMLVLAAWAVALASFAFSMYLTYIELAVIDAICTWCVASTTIMTALFVALSAGAYALRDHLLDDAGAGIEDGTPDVDAVM